MCEWSGELPSKLNSAYDALDPSEIEIQRAELAHAHTLTLSSHKVASCTLYERNKTYLLLTALIL